MNTVLALDPGVTTGYAYCEVEDGRIATDIILGQSILSPAGLFGLLESVNPTFLIAESFEYRQEQRDGLVLTSRNLLGVCELWAELRNTQYRSQSASTGKAFFRDSKLREIKKYQRGKRHARDAQRHLLTFLCFHSNLLIPSERHKLIRNEAIA